MSDMYGISITPFQGLGLCAYFNIPLHGMLVYAALSGLGLVCLLQHPATRDVVYAALSGLGLVSSVLHPALRDVNLSGPFRAINVNIYL